MDSVQLSDPAATTREKRSAEAHVLRAKLSFNEEQLGEGILSGVSRAALEMLPGAPKNIFDSLPDQDEAKCMDAMMVEVVGYLHRGRHRNVRANSAESSQSITPMPGSRLPSPGCSLLRHRAC